MSGSSNNRFENRPLVPRRAIITSNPAVAPGAVSEPRSLASKRRPTSRACDACRKHKSKCSGDRPKCDHCLKNNTVCHYGSLPNETQSQVVKRKLDEAEARNAIYEELFSLMNSMSKDEVANIVAMLGAGSDIAAVLKQVKEANLLLQVALVPETRYRHQLPYGSQIPASLLYERNPYVHSLVYEAASAYCLPFRPGTPEAGFTERGETVVSATLRERLSSSETQSLYLKPLRAASLVDPRLEAVKPSLWTSVSDDDKLMRSLLGAYFLYEQATFTTFQKDYFLEDMANQKLEFCSALLVNVLLAYSCSCFRGLKRRSEHWNPRSLGYQFLAEAKRLWELDSSTPRLPSVHAAMLINIVQNLCGFDEIGHQYGKRAVAMSQALGLFDRNARVQNDRTQSGRDFTAWAVFNWQSVPWVLEPPPTPPPDPFTHSSWYGEVWVQYPLNRTITPTQFGAVFQAYSASRAITNEMCREMFTDGHPAFTAERALEYYSRYEQWYKSLPEPLQPSSIVLPAHLGLHLDYHFMVITLLTPFVDETADPESLPRLITKNAKKDMQTVLYLWYLRHGFEDMNGYLISPLTFVAFTLLQSITSTMPSAEREAARSALLLVTKGLQEQSRNSYLAEAIFTSVKKQMADEELRCLQRIADITVVDEKERQDQMQLVQSQWMELNCPTDPTSPPAAD